MTLAQAIDFAMNHNATIAQQRALVSQAQSQYVRQRSQTLPGVLGQLQNQMQKSENYSNYSIIQGASQASVFSQNSVSLGTSYTFNGGLAFFQTLADKQQLDQAQANLQQTRRQVTDSVSDAYFQLASKDEAVRLDQGDLQYQHVLLTVAQAKERAGVAAGVDVLSARAAEEKSRYTLEAAQADSENSRESLSQTIGAPLETQFDVPAAVPQPPLPGQDLDHLIALAQVNRPEVLSAYDAVQIARTNRRAADTDLYPQIQTFGQIGNQFSPTTAAQLGALGNRGTPGYWLLGVTSTISLPLVDWGARAANHRNLNDQIAAAQTQLDSTRGQVELDVRQQYRAAETALAQLASAQEESRFAQEAARVAQLQYEHGIITLVDVQQRQQSALSAQTDLYNARVGYVDAVVKLRVATGLFDSRSAVADL
ncbi:MAG TPA: TolC family protein [Candidatus Baltobacteraceae bacterium]|nr:TolC family protein [Candidatus Baltobacteraceae bacterium]